MAMRLYLLAGAGSFVGGVLRFAISHYFVARFSTAFPYHTFFINIIGSFFIGVIAALALRGSVSEDWKVFLAVGVCGGFTTFSAFSLEMLDLMRSGAVTTALIYAAASLVLGLLAAFAGFQLIK
ncbi:MAG: fluoride efflux transporter CrcB [Acidobacteria bacterium]|nr:fluoride efflux transporter CrcB [Acidobacteriota bacterium]